jgi:DtxR family transcriptional regulator, Mn-dependent transcriptional regulator
MPFSVTEENYIKAIYNLTQEAGLTHTGTNELSKHLNNKAASVSDMLTKLADKDLIDYKKYHGVKLSKKGMQTALQIIRKHRLWEVFLVEKLHFKWDEVHEIAEQLEHIQSEELINRLDKFLDFPERDPHGDVIPNNKGQLKTHRYAPLNNCKEKDKVVFSGVKSQEPEFLRHLSLLGLKPGQKMEVMRIDAFDGIMEIRCHPGKKTFTIGRHTAANLLIEKL